MKNKFIVIEGCDFTGKSSVIEKLGKSLDLHNIKVKTTQALGGTKLGKKIREQLMNGRFSMSISDKIDKGFLALKDMNYEVVLNEQKDGSFVVCDRYYHSSIVYQGICQNAPEMVEERLSQANLIEPDLTFILDCKTSVILQRMKTRAETNAYDPKDGNQVEKIRNAYLTLAQRKNTVLIDTTNLTVEQTVEKIMGFTS